MGTPRTDHFTAADLATMPDDGRRYEVINGELFVTPAPGGRHQPIVTRLMGSLLPYLSAGGLPDQLLTSPADLTLAFDTLVEPDLLVVDTRAFIRSGKWIDVTNPFLVIEIISPSTARTDRTLKRRAYQHHGVPHYWIVDAEQRQVEVWTPDAAAAVVSRDRVSWRHPALDGECTIDLVRLFDFG